MEQPIRSIDYDATIAAGCARPRHSAWLISALACAVILLWFMAREELRGSDGMLSWYLIPLTLCGILIGEDAVRWFRGEIDVFDPIGIVGLFGVHFFLLAPLLHTAWNYWIEEVVPPSDWRTWLGGMAVLNLVGLMAYRATRSWVCAGVAQGKSAAVVWRLDRARFNRYLKWMLLVSAGLQIAIYARFGGLSGYLAAVARDEHVFLGFQWIAMISEIFPVLALMGYAVHTWARPKPSWPTLLLILLAYCVLKLFFGGLYGSRNNILFAVFWAVGIVHFAIRPVPKQLILGGILAMIPFLYVYGFYKSAGIEGLQRALRSPQARADVAEEIHRPIEVPILGDLGRSDVQAFVLYRLMQPESDYQYSFGRTYVGAVLALLPGPIWRDRPPTKAKEGTIALFGREAYRDRPLSATYAKDRYDGRTSRLFGITGEAMLNFGPLSVPVAMAVLGFVVGWVRRWMLAWDKQDMRRLILPFLVNLCVMLLLLDSDNTVTMLQQNLFVPLAFLSVTSTRYIAARQSVRRKCRPPAAIPASPPEGSP